MNYHRVHKCVVTIVFSVLLHGAGGEVRAQIGDGQKSMVARLAGESCETLRNRFKTAIENNSPDLLHIASALFMHPESTVQEQIEILTLVQLMGDDIRFQVHYNQLPDDVRKLESVGFLKARMLIQMGQTAAARNLLDQYFAGGGANQRFALLQTGLNLLPGMPEEVSVKGQKKLAELLESKGETTRKALALLWKLPAGRIKEEYFPKNTGAVLDGITEVQVAERLALAKIDLVRLKGSPDEQKSLVQHYVDAHGKEDPEVVGAWLARLGLVSKVLEVVDEEAGQKSLAAYDLRLQALTVVHGPAEAENWLQKPHPEASPFLVNLNRAWLAFSQKDLTQMRACFRQSLRYAGEAANPRMAYLQIYRTAMQLREMDMASRALTEAAGNPGKGFPSSRQIGPVVNHFYRSGDFESLQLIFGAVAEIEPANITVLNNFAYSSMMLGDVEEDLLKLSEKLIEENPDVVGLRTTLAFGLLQRKEWEKALKVVSGESLAWSEASPADLAIRALAMEKNGLMEEARKVREEFKAAPLSSVEKSAFDAL